jgi:hypothetical protein
VADDYKVTVTMRVSVEDRTALLAAAGDAVPAAAREDEDLAVQIALQELVPIAVLTRLPGARLWQGNGWHAQVSASKWRGDEVSGG